MNDRERERGWRELLRSARREPFGLALEGVCMLELEAIKTRLLDAPDNEIPALQGEGRALRRILKYLTERPLPQPQRFDNPVSSPL